MPFFVIPAGDGFLSRQVSKVEFQPNTARPQPTMPPDISHDEFEYVEDVQTSCMPRSQLPTVLSSYEKTIGTIKIFTSFSSWLSYFQKCSLVAWSE